MWIINFQVCLTNQNTICLKAWSLLWDNSRWEKKKKAVSLTQYENFSHFLVEWFWQEHWLGLSGRFHGTAPTGLKASVYKICKNCFNKTQFNIGGKAALTREPFNLQHTQKRGKSLPVSEVFLFCFFPHSFVTGCSILFCFCPVCLTVSIFIVFTHGTPMVKTVYWFSIFFLRKIFLNLSPTWPVAFMGFWYYDL